MGYPAELWTHRQQQQGLAHRAIELDTPLYADCETARAFGKWPHEFYALDPLEQDVCRWFLRLRAEKDAYGMRNRADRAIWPKDPPIHRPHQ